MHRAACVVLRCDGAIDAHAAAAAGGGGWRCADEEDDQDQPPQDQRPAPEEDFDSEEEELDDFIVYGPDEEQERRKARKERRHAGTMGISQSQLDEAASIFGGDMSEFLQNQLDEEDYDVRRRRRLFAISK